MHQVLGGWDIDLVGVVVDALEHFERFGTAWGKLGFSFIWEMVLAEV